MLWCPDTDEGDLISNLKLRKLVYSCQALQLALYDMPLFTEDVVAWQHGPVTRELYNAYKHFERNPVPKPDHPPLFDDETRDFSDEVYQVYGQFSAWKLRNLTHEEDPYTGVTHNQVISHESMRTYYKRALQ